MARKSAAVSYRMTMETTARAIEVLAAAATDLAAITRAKHYAQWRDGAARDLTNDLSQLPPFAPLMRLWIHTGDGSGCTGSPRLGNWAIDCLVRNMQPAEIVEAFAAEAARNVGRYSDVSIVYGVSIDATCDLHDGVTLTPGSAETIAPLLDSPLSQRGLVAPNTTLLRQTFTVTPAYVLPFDDGVPQGGLNITAPTSAAREVVRQRVRLACLVAGTGGAEILETQLQPDQRDAIVGGAGNGMGRMFAARPFYNTPLKAEDVQAAYRLLGQFQDLESLTRAIERLGRSRIATHTVDRFLELGMAAEIALMHDHSATNTEITHKISGRAAWLLGRSPEERQTIFEEVRKLYSARSTAVHAGRLPTKSSISPQAADELVRRVLFRILERGRFPNWTNLTLGGDGWG